MSCLYLVGVDELVLLVKGYCFLGRKWVCLLLVVDVGIFGFVVWLIVGF